MGKNFQKTVVLREEFRNWKEDQQKKAKGFFPVYNEFLKYLSLLSPGACSLYLYFGLHSKNLTGESFHDVKKIASFFGKTPRTIRSWISELEKHKLIYRLQVKYNGVTYTYLLPYGEDSLDHINKIEKKFLEIDANKDEDF